MQDNYLSILLFLPVVFALLIPFIKANEGARNIHFFGIGASVVIFLFSALVWNLAATLPPMQVDAFYALLSERYAWLPSLGISYALGIDGLSLTLVFLTTFLLVMSAVASLSSITHRVKLYYAMLMILTTAILGVFLARDLFLFFLFYELELVPMYLLIAVWGGPRKDYAALKFVLYTLFGSVFMLVAILGLYFHAAASGAPTDSLFLFETIQSKIPLLAFGAQIWIFLGLFLAFSVKLPVVPFHTWLPDAHVEAPTPVSMLLAGILLKMGAYGMMRFCWEFLPMAALRLAPWIAVLAVINIVYTAGVALVQKDLKKLIAYSSVSHMGFVLLGLAAMNPAGFNGAVFVMFAHGLVSAALFMCVGTLYTRTHSRLIADYGGFGAQTPAIFYFFMFMSLASLGLPLLISFASETLVFYGAFTSDFFNLQLNLLGILPVVWNMQVATILSAIGIVIGAAYLLWMLQRVFFGPLPKRWAGLSDASLSEVFVLSTLAVLVLVLGINPQLLTSRFEPEISAKARVYEVFRRLESSWGKGFWGTGMGSVPPGQVPAENRRLVSSIQEKGG